MQKVYRWLVGYKSRSNYWSNTDLNNKLRVALGLVPQPQIATAEEWAEWRAANKGKIGYWITDVAVDAIQDFVYFLPDVYNNASRYIRNRYIEKTHIIDTQLARGEYYDFDTKILHGTFSELVRFVEVEKAHMQTLDTANCPPIPWYKTPFVPPLVPSRDLGMAHLEWEMTLTETSPKQAETAAKIVKLYTWWKDARPNRADPAEASGLDAWIESRSNNEDELHDYMFSANKSPEEKETEHKIYEEFHRIEEEYYKEDTDMLIELISIRRECWT